MQTNHHTWAKSRARGVLAWATLGLAACGSEQDYSGVEPWAGEEVEGIPELTMPLTALTTDCTYANQIATVTVESGETAIISRRAVDSALLVNGYPCANAITTTMRRVNVVELGSATGDETVVIDFLGGAFGAGSASGVGINIDMGVGTADNLRIRGSASVDRFTVGANGISTGTDVNLDITFANVDSVVFSLGAGADVFSAAGGTGTGAVYAGVLTVYGGDANDIITGGSGNDIINGGAGNDTITGGLGDDTLAGDAGNDTFSEGAVDSGSDTFAGGADTDTVSYSARTSSVTVTVGAGANDGETGEGDAVAADVEIVIGGLGDDSLTGDAGNNTLRGGPGDDTLVGGLGDDILMGEADDDIFDEGTADSGSDTFTCGTGTDLIDYSGRTNNLTVTMASGADDGEDDEDDNVGSDCENLTGGDGNDDITGNALVNVLDGGLGDDTLRGLAGADTFVQAATDDGGDIFIGGDGIDTVDYSTRTASVTVTMDGVAANDGLVGEADDVRADVENLLCGEGDDNVTGNALDNTISGGDGADTISGGAGNDVISGDADGDTLNGDAGDDIIDGGGGDNDLDCGTGEGDIGFNVGAGGSTTGCEL